MISRWYRYFHRTVYYDSQSGDIMKWTISANQQNRKAYAFSPNHRFTYLFTAALISAHTEPSSWRWYLWYAADQASQRFLRRSLLQIGSLAFSFFGFNFGYWKSLSLMFHAPFFNGLAGSASLLYVVSHHLDWAVYSGVSMNLVFFLIEPALALLSQFYAFYQAAIIIMMLSHSIWFCHELFCKGYANYSLDQELIVSKGRLNCLSDHSTTFSTKTNYTTTLKCKRKTIFWWSGRNAAPLLKLAASGSMILLNLKTSIVKPENRPNLLWYYLSWFRTALPKTWRIETRALLQLRDLGNLHSGRLILPLY